MLSESLQPFHSRQYLAALSFVLFSLVLCERVCVSVSFCTYLSLCVFVCVVYMRKLGFIPPYRRQPELDNYAPKFCKILTMVACKLKGCRLNKTGLKG